MDDKGHEVLDVTVTLLFLVALMILAVMATLGEKQWVENGRTILMAIAFAVLTYYLFRDKWEWESREKDKGGTP